MLVTLLTSSSAYFHSAATLNFVRGALSSGIADLHRPLDWGLGHVQDPDLQAKYSSIVASITESLRFMQTVGADTAGQLQTVDLFTSHEGLLLEYEQSLTRRLKKPALKTTPMTRGRTDDAAGDGKAYYNTSAHFLWVGDRTRQIDGAHIEYFRGIENPIGVKIGPTTASSDIFDSSSHTQPIGRSWQDHTDNSLRCLQGSRLATYPHSCSRGERVRT